jgi:hypothetical protein
VINDIHSAHLIDVLNETQKVRCFGLTTKIFLFENPKGRR